MNNNIDEKKIQEAKEKLACKIGPREEHKPAADTGSCGSSSCAVAPSASSVRLTQMTTAGG